MAPLMHIDLSISDRWLRQAKAVWIEAATPSFLLGIKVEGDDMELRPGRAHCR
jgi:hypothetical protein